MRDLPQSRVDDLLSRQLSSKAIAAGAGLKMRTSSLFFFCAFQDGIQSLYLCKIISIL